MNPIQIGRKRLSNVVWGIIDEKVPDTPLVRIANIIAEQQFLRGQADYKTGSVDEENAAELYRIVRFFSPATIAEVGTFIGVSTKVMDIASPGVVSIYTCDMSNDINLGMLPNVVQYPKTTSHDMFRDLSEKGVKVDLFYLDGRLHNNDVKWLNKIVHDKTVFVMDDFEGVEKGVANALMLESPGRVLIYPRKGRKTAVSIPFTLLQVVPQEAV